MKNSDFYNIIKEKLNKKEVDFQDEIISKRLDVYNLSIDNLIYIGGGNNGIAYYSNDKVVKLTKDKGEVEVAIKLKNKKNTYLVNIYDVIKLNDEFYLIVQEKVSTKHNDLKNCRVWIIDLFRDGNFDFEEIIYGEEMNDVLDLKGKTFLGEKCNEFNFKFIHSAFLAYEEVKSKTGIKSRDFHVFNSGVRSDGSVVFFDQRNDF